MKIIGISTNTKRQRVIGAALQDPRSTGEARLIARCHFALVAWKTPMPLNEKKPPHSGRSEEAEG